APNSPSEMAVYSVDGTKLTQNTMGIGSNFGNYAINNAIDPTKPFTINVRARVLQSEETQSGGRATAFGVWAFTGAEVFGFSMNTTTLNAPAGQKKLIGISRPHNFTTSVLRQYLA